MSHSSAPYSIAEEKLIIQEENQRYYAFVNLALFLSLVTSAEIVLIFIPVAKWIIISLLVGLSVIKFFCVILWFMHLIYDKVLLFIIFLSGLVIATGTIFALMALFAPEHVDYKIFSTMNELYINSKELRA